MHNFLWQYEDNKIIYKWNLILIISRLTRKKGIKIQFKETTLNKTKVKLNGLNSASNINYDHRKYYLTVINIYF